MSLPPNPSAPALQAIPLPRHVPGLRIVPTLVRDTAVPALVERAACVHCRPLHSGTALHKAAVCEPHAARLQRLPGAKPRNGLPLHLERNPCPCPPDCPIPRRWRGQVDQWHHVVSGLPVPGLLWAGVGGSTRWLGSGHPAGRPPGSRAAPAVPRARRCQPPRAQIPPAGQRTGSQTALIPPLPTCGDQPPSQA